MKLRQRSYLAVVGLALLLCQPVFAADPPRVERATRGSAPVEKVVIGEAEFVWIPALEAVFRARIDTGATTTSIFAVDIEAFERDGKSWVRFVIKHPDRDYPMEMPVARIASIKKRGVEGFTDRYAVALDLVMGDMTRQVKVNLADRTGFEYPLLVGRDLLHGIAIVDVTKIYSQRTPGAPESEISAGD